MLTLSDQQVFSRWPSLSPALREALFSQPNADFVWNLCTDEHLPEEKRYDVAEISGYVLMGFLHPEDLAGELAATLALDPKITKTIADEINKRIFVPLRADIDKVYEPVSKLAPSPMPIRDISSGQAQAMTPKPVPLSPAPSAPSSFTKIPPASEGKFAPMSGAPWPTKPAPEPSKIAPGNWTTQKSAVVTPAASSSDPAPIMLHEDAKFSASDKNTDFHLSRPGGGAEVSLEGVKPEKAVKPAVLELGTLTNTPAAQNVGPKFTHYTQFSSSPTPNSEASAVSANTAPRNVTEVTGAPNVTAAPVVRPESTPIKPMSSSKPPVAQTPIPQPPKPPAPKPVQAPRPGQPPIQKNYP